jgi:uncharacterized repeat protein (TIGR03943 family)
VTPGISSLILLLFGAALVRLGASNELLLYVRPVARPWVLSAGIAIVLLAGWSMLSRLRSQVGARTADAADDHAPASASGEKVEDDEHRHDGATRTAWLVLAPVVAILVVAPPALSVYTADRAPALNPVATGRSASLQAGAAPVQLSVLDFLLLSNARPAALTGRQVSLIGFVEGAHPGGFILARLVITCCAADASTGRVAVMTRAEVPARGGWVEVTGTFAGAADATGLPGLSATAVTPTAEPTNPYD